MKPNVENIFKKASAAGLGQLTEENREQDQSRQQWKRENTDKIIDALVKDPSKIFVVAGVCAGAYFIYQLYQENKQIKEELKELKHETRSRLSGMRRELMSKKKKDKRRVEDVFEVTDVEGSYVIEIDEKADTKSAAPSEPIGNNSGFLA
ncbi:MAG: hypothetical protein ACOYXT_12580 [Bacteroidota bacterium]